MKEYDCEECGEDRQKMRGCTKELDKPLYVDHPVFGSIRRCPRKLITMETRRVMRAYHHYQSGFLPRSGGSEDQELRTMEGIEIIGATVAEIREERRRKGNRD